jgi:hypothetical protein
MDFFLEAGTFRFSLKIWGPKQALLVAPPVSFKIPVPVVHAVPPFFILFDGRRPA